MTRIRKQHYVPQFYLKQFGTNLHIYDKTTGKTFKTNPSDIGFEIDFYGIAVEGDEYVEQYFRKLETRFSSSYYTFLEQKGFSDEQFEIFATFSAFIAVQFLRTRQHRDYVVNNYQFLFDRLAKNLGVDDWRIILTDDGKIAAHLSSILNWEIYASIVGNMKFIVLENKTDIPFWTSDNPVFLMNEFTQPPFGNLGIICRGIELHFPLTPQLSILVCDPSLYGNVPSYLAITNKKNILYENYLQFNSARRHIISNSSDFQFATSLNDKTFKIEDISKPLSVPPYVRTDLTKPDFWPEDESLNQLWKIMEQHKSKSSN